MDATQKLQVAEEFLRRLVNPGVYGLTINDEVRKEAVRALTIIRDSK